MYENQQELSNREYPLYVLHSPVGVFWAAFFGTPFAAGIVMAMNYWRVERQTAALNTIIFGILATIALFAIIFIIPEGVLNDMPKGILSFPLVFLLYALAKILQNDILERHIADGGDVASAWISAGIGALCLPIIGGCLIGIYYLIEPPLGTVIQFGNDEVYYAGEATEDEARKLAGALKEVGFFGNTRTSVRLNVSSGKYDVSFMLVENAWNEKQTVEAFQDIGSFISSSGFPAPLTVYLCDTYFSIKKTIPIE